MKTKTLLSIVITIVAISNSIAQDWLQIQKVLPSNTPIDNADWFSFSIASEDNILVVGSPYYDNNKGCTYVMEKETEQWKTVAILSASSPIEGGFFGASVGISGNKIVVGSIGKAYVFNKPENGWQNMAESDTIAKPSGTSNSNFGIATAISGNTIAIGAYTNDVENGKVYIYEHISTIWTKKAVLLVDNLTFDDMFGKTVRISGNIVVVGSNLPTYPNEVKGSAYVFEKPENGWVDMTETAKLTSSDLLDNGSLGSSVAICNDVILIGAHYASNNQGINGAAYLYQKPEGGWDDMTETAKLESSDYYEEQFFSKSITLNDTMAVVGAHWNESNGDYSGAAYVFKKPEDGWSSMTETEKLLPTDGSIRDEFGISVAIAKNTIFVGALGAGIESDEITDAGALYIFKNVNAPTSLFGQTHHSNISIFPNSSNGQFSIHAESQILNIKVLTIDGKLIFEKKSVAKKNRVDLSHLKSGCYIITIKTRERVCSKKIFLF